MEDRIARAIVGALRERDLSGHEVWHWLGPRHGAHLQLTESTLYPILYRLEAERVILGAWREGERTRRVYRLAGTGIDMVESHGWQPMARRTDPDPILTAPAVDPDAVARTQALLPDDSAEPGEPAAAPYVAPATEREYLDRLEARLRLSELHTSEVRDEIRGHLQDCAEELVEAGMDPDTAATEAITRLGSPEILARAINEAQLTRPRLMRGLRGAAVAALFGGALGIAGAAIAIMMAPLVARLLTVVAGLAGIRLYAPETSEWWAQQLFLTIAAGAFFAARRSLPFVAIYTRRAESVIRPAWALTGAIPLTAIALLMPANVDPLTVLSLVALPVGFVAGTWLSQGHGDDLVSRKGILWATPLLAALLLTPGGRIWFYDPAAGPALAAPAAADSTSAHINWDNTSLGQGAWRVTIEGVDVATWHDARVEFWPARRSGLAVVPDGSAVRPGLTAQSDQVVDLTGFRNVSSDWWVTLTAAGPDGTRRTLATDVQYGASDPRLENLLNRILGHG